MAENDSDTNVTRVSLTSSHIYGEFLSLLHIFSHHQAVKSFYTFGEPSNSAFTLRHAASFFHNRAAIGLACAQAIDIRTHAAHTLPGDFFARAPRTSFDPLLLSSLLMAPKPSLFLSLPPLPRLVIAAG